MKPRSRGPSFLYFFREYPRQTGVMLCFLLLAGLVETVGAVSLVPLLAGLFDETATSTGLLSKFAWGFGMVGLPLTMPCVLLVICTATVLKSLLTLLAFRQTGYVEAEVSTRLRAELLDNLLQAKWPYFISQPAGALTYALSTESPQAGVAMRSFCQVLSHLAQTCTYLLAGLFLSWPLMLAALLCGGVFIYLFRGLILSVRRAGVRQAETLNAMTAVFTDGLAGAKPLKVMGAEANFLGYVRAQSERCKIAARQHVMGVGLLGAVQEPVLTLILAGGLYWSKQALRIDGVTLIAMAFFFQRIISRFSSAQQGYQQYAALEGLLTSLRDKIEELKRHREPEGRGDRLQLRQGVRLSCVGFQYSNRHVLRDFDLDVPVGAITALCGPSGSGKTTVADLIVGLIRPDSGSVTVDGTPVEELDQQHWRHQIGYVPQEVFLFHDTIRNNVALGRDMPDEQIWEALDQAGAKGFVSQAGMNLDFLVGEQGRALSGGQRQRLMIARAIASKPRLLILDEATAGLDEATAKEIWSRISLLKKDMAVLAISHQDTVLAVADHVRRFDKEKGHTLEPVDNFRSMT